MAGSWYIVRSELRRRRTALIGLVLLAGLGGGLVLATASGARRTATAYDRFLSASNAGHVLVSSSSGSADYEPVRQVEGVEAVAPVLGLELMPSIEADVTDVMNIASIDGTFGYEVDRPNVLDGRLPSRGRTDELFVNQRYVDAFDVHVGDRIELVAETEDQARFPVTIVGVGVFSTDVVPTTDLDALPTALVPPALARTILAEADVVGFDGASVVQRDPTDPRLIDAAAAALGEEAFVLERTATHATVERAIRPQATAMWAFAVVVTVAAVFVVAQSVARQAALAIAQNPALDAVGVRRRERIQQAAMLHALVGVAAAVLAVAVAVVASPLFPIGRARAAEPRRGVEVNLAVLGAGAAVVVVLVGTAAAVSAWAATRPGGGRGVPRPSVLAATAASVGAPPRVVLGIRRAFEAGSGSAAVPVRSGLVGASLAVAAVVATATFATSLDALVTEPARYGQSWALTFDAQFAPAPAGELLERYGDDPRVDGIGGLAYAEVGIEGRQVPVITFERLDGDLGPVILDGRAPRSPDEVALGARSLDEVGADLGDELAVETPTGPARWTVVGTAVFPQLSQGSFSALGLGTGGLVDPSALPSPFDEPTLAEALETGDLPPGWTPDRFLVDGHAYNAVVFDAAPEDARAIAAELEGHPLAELVGVRRDQRPAAISTYSEVRATPVVLAVLLAGLASGLVTHVLLTAIRRRRKELAICRVIGMRGRDVLAIVRWQATAVAVTAAVIGVPLGLAGGRMAWRLFADDLGVPAGAPMAWGWIGVATAGTLLIANAGAALPGWRASRVRPATALRAE